jgi:hypothetical protein
MENLRVYTLSKDNIKRYIYNTDPLLWIDDESKAKIFRSKGEIEEDLYCHRDYLEKINKELGIVFIVEQVL